MFLRKGPVRSELTVLVVICPDEIVCSRDDALVFKPLVSCSVMHGIMLANCFHKLLLWLLFRHDWYLATADYVSCMWSNYSSRNMFTRVIHAPSRWVWCGMEYLSGEGVAFGMRSIPRRPSGLELLPNAPPSTEDKTSGHLKQFLSYSVRMSVFTHLISSPGGTVLPRTVNGSRKPSIPGLVFFPLLSECLEVTEGWPHLPPPDSPSVDYSSWKMLINAHVCVSILCWGIVHSLIIIWPGLALSYGHCELHLFLILSFLFIIVSTLFHSPLTVSSLCLFPL